MARTRTSLRRQICESIDWKRFILNRGIGDFQRDVLEAIVSLKKEAYGVRIRDLVQEKRGRSVSTPQVYSALTRLVELGLVYAKDDRLATAGKRGRPRRIYQLKPSGLQLLSLLASEGDLLKMASTKEKSYVGTTWKGKVSMPKMVT